MDNPFAQFGISHLSALALMAVAALGLVAVVRRWRHAQFARIARWALAALLVASWILWLMLLYRRGWFSAANILPMHLCDWATIIVIITLVRPNQQTYELAYFWTLGGTLQALLTPDLGHDFPDLRFIVFFALHGGVIASVLFLTLGLGMRPWLSSIPRVAAWSLVYLAAAIAVNALFGTNYGYLAAKPAHPSLLDFFAPWPYYIGEMVLAGIAFIILYYSPFLVWDWLRRKRGSFS